MMNPSNGLFSGIAAPIRGTIYLLANPSLFRYVIASLLAGLFVALAALGVIVAGVYAFVTQAHPRFSRDVVGILLEIGAAMAALIAVLATAVILWFLLTAIISAYFNKLLARAVELRLGTPAGSMSETTTAQDIADALAALPSLILINLILLLVGLVPVVGWLIALPLWLYHNARIMGLQYLDYPMSLRGLRRAQKLTVIKAHPGPTLGLGIVTLGLGLIPVVGAAIGATAVIGAVMLHRPWTGRDYPSPS